MDRTEERAMLLAAQQCASVTTDCQACPLLERRPCRSVLQMMIDERLAELDAMDDDGR